MKTFLLTTTAAALAIMGCDTVSPEHIDTSKSYPDLHTGEADSTGTLYVGGVGPVNPRERSEAGKSPMVTLFSVYDVNGNLVTWTRDNTVELPPGRYMVRLENVDEDQHTPFWVTVEPGKQTVVSAERVYEEHGRLNAK